MKICKILIDLSSIRKNPNAGRKEFMIPGQTHIKEVYEHGVIVDGYLISYDSKIMKRFKKDKDLFDSVEELLKVDLTTVGVIDRDRLFGKLLLREDNREITTHRTFHPDSNYLFEYESKNIKCRYCNSKFDHTELASDSSNDGVGYSDTVCPKCGLWDCCIIEYEDIEDALKRRDE